MKEHAIPVGHLVFPILLPLRERIFLQEAVGANDQRGGCGFKTDTALDADDGVADVHVTADTISRTDFFQLADGSDGVVEVLAIDSFEFAFLEGEGQLLCAGLGHLLQIGSFRKSLF